MIGVPIYLALQGCRPLTQLAGDFKKIKKVVEGSAAYLRGATR
jgi:hypothetical protein